MRDGRAEKKSDGDVSLAEVWDASLISDADPTVGVHCRPAMTPPSTGRTTPVMKLA
jgi:hypothetical protein